MKLNTRSMLILAGLLAVSPLGHVVAQESTVEDKDIHVLDFEELKYPNAALTACFQGVVVIRVKLDDQGKVADAAALSGSNLCIPACLANIKKWRFQPNAQKTAVIVYNFRMAGGVCKSEQSLFVLQGPNLATVIRCDQPHL